MRLVQWHPQERVDVPDKVAENFLVLGEFRRFMREMVLGESANYLVRGFAVEPESPATSRIVVKLDNGGGVLSAAVGAENLGVRITYGQLMGGLDDNGNLEGNAQQTLDFSGQPNATYRVQARFVYADGAADNRAFWNPSTDSEFVDNVPTRHLPGFELRLSGAASGEWIDLADVVWGGATIVAGNITDVRDFVMEGQPPYQQSTQNGTGGAPDFSRSTSRAGLSVGRNAVYEVLRALARQIQDIKGPDDSGNWNWWNRPFSPFDPNSALAAEQTKTLRSIDTVTYTIGDGVQHIGDFNGTTGLDDALSHLAAIPDAQRPERVEIVIYGGSYTISGQKAIPPRSLREMTLILRGGPKYVLASASSFQRPTITIDGDSLGAGEFGIVTQNGSSLEIYNLNFAWTGTSAGGRHMLGASGAIVAEDCDISHSVALAGPDVAAGFALFSSRAYRSRVSRCTIRGRLCFYDLSATPPVSARETGIIEQCWLRKTQILLYSPSGGGGSTDQVSRFVIRDCQIEGRGSADSGDIYSNSAVATIDARAAQYLTVERCTIAHNVNENGIDGREYASSRPFAWRIVDCVFGATDDFGTPHAVNGGSSTTNGTGWNINIQSSAGTPTVAHQIRGCRFSGDSIDAGGIRLNHVRAPVVESCEWEFCQHGAGGSDSYTAILVNATSAGFESRAKLRGLTINRWLGGARTRGIYLTNVVDVALSDCTLRGDEFDGTDITGRTNADCALRLSEVSYVRITGSTFERWNYGTTTSACLIAVASTDADRCVISACTFRDNGNYAIDWAGDASNAGPLIDACHVTGGADSNNLGIHLTSAATNFILSNASIRLNSGAGFDALFCGPTQNPAGTVIAVRSNGDFRKTGVNIIKGYQPDDTLAGFSTQINAFNAYT